MVDNNDTRSNDAKCRRIDRSIDIHIRCAGALGMPVEQYLDHILLTGKNSFKPIRGARTTVNAENGTTKTTLLDDDNLLFLQNGISAAKACAMSFVFLQPLLVFAKWNVRQRPTDLKNGHHRLSVTMLKTDADTDTLHHILVTFFGTFTMHTEKHGFHFNEPNDALLLVRLMNRYQEIYNHLRDEQMSARSSHVVWGAHSYLTCHSSDGVERPPKRHKATSEDNPAASSRSTISTDQSCTVADSNENKNGTIANDTIAISNQHDEHPTASADSHTDRSYRDADSTEEIDTESSGSITGQISQSIVDMGGCDDVVFADDDSMSLGSEGRAKALTLAAGFNATFAVTEPLIDVVVSPTSHACQTMKEPAAISKPTVEHPVSPSDSYTNNSDSDAGSTEKNTVTNLGSNTTQISKSILEERIGAAASPTVNETIVISKPTEKQPMSSDSYTNSSDSDADSMEALISQSVQEIPDKIVAVSKTSDKNTVDDSSSDADTTDSESDVTIPDANLISITSSSAVIPGSSQPQQMAERIPTTICTAAEENQVVDPDSIDGSSKLDALATQELQGAKSGSINTNAAEEIPVESSASINTKATEEIPVESSASINTNTTEDIPVESSGSITNIPTQQIAGSGSTVCKPVAHTVASDDFQPDWGDVNAESETEHLMQTAPVVHIPRWFMRTCNEPILSRSHSHVVCRTLDSCNSINPFAWTRLKMPALEGIGNCFLTEYRQTAKQEFTDALVSIRKHSVALIVNCQSRLEFMNEQSYFQNTSGSIKVILWDPTTLSDPLSDMQVVKRVIQTLVSRKTVMFHCNCGLNRAAVQACKVLMLIHGCGWQVAAQMLLCARPSVCIDVDSWTAASLPAFQRVLYNSDNLFDLECRGRFFMDVQGQCAT